MWYLLSRLQLLLDYYGPCVILMFMNFPYCYAILSLCLYKSMLAKEKESSNNLSKVPEQSVKTANTCEVPLTSLLINIGFCLIMFLLLQLCGDVPPNPGPMKFCHLNARSLLAGVDLDTHMEDQYSLLDDIYECLVYIKDLM